MMAGKKYGEGHPKEEVRVDSPLTTGKARKFMADEEPAGGSFIRISKLKKKNVH